MQVLEGKITELEKELEIQRQMTRAAQQAKDTSETKSAPEVTPQPVKTQEGPDSAQVAAQNAILKEQLAKIQGDFQSQMLIEQELRTKNDQM